MIWNAQRKSVNSTRATRSTLLPKPPAVERDAAGGLRAGRPLVPGEEEDLGEQDHAEPEGGRPLALQRVVERLLRSTPSSMITNRNSTTIALA